MRSQYAHTGLEHAGDPWTPLLNWKLIGAIIHSDTWAEVSRRCKRTQGACITQASRMLDAHYSGWRKMWRPRSMSGLTPEGRVYWASEIAREVKARQWSKDMFLEKDTPFLNMELEMSDKPEGFYMVKGPGSARVKHDTSDIALREAVRLAELSPGEPFYIMKATKVVIYDPQPQPVVRDL